MYIPVKTKYVFDYRERGYYEIPKWIAYFFTWKNEYSQVCRNNASFDCGMFQYSGVFPRPSLHAHHVTTESFSAGYRVTDHVHNYENVTYQLYHQFVLPENKQFYTFKLPNSLLYKHEYYTIFQACIKREGRACFKYALDHFRNVHIHRDLKVLILDPYWKLIGIRGKYSGEVLDHYIISEELTKTVYRSIGINVCGYNISLCICVIACE